MSELRRKVSHPGVFIKDAIDELGLNQTEFALRTGLSIKNVSTLLNGESNVTFDVALKLASFFSNSIEGWINLQTKYDLFISQKHLEEEKEKEWEIVKLFDKKFVSDVLNITIDVKNKEKTIVELRGCFGVGTLNALKENDMYAFCKTAVKKNLSDKNVIMRNAWISLAEKEARKQICNEFNKKVIFENLLNLRKLTLENPDTFEPKLFDILKNAGIKLVILPYLKNSLVGGVTKWISNENCVMIAVNDCGKDADKIWFSIFHELGHAMKNHKRHLSISYEKEQIEDADELAANKFARELLIDEDAYQEYVSKNIFNELSIKKFAKEQNVADFIVLGRLQKDKFVDWNKYQYMKKKYQINI